MSFVKIKPASKIKLASSTNFENIYSLDSESYNKLNFFENVITPIYPMQTWGWVSDFWLSEKKAADGHEAFLISECDSTKNYWVQAVVYKYPWHTGEVFLTIPRGPVFSFNFNKASEAVQTKLLLDFKKSLEAVVNITKACFVKIESSWDGSQILDLTTGDTDIADLKYDSSNKLLDHFKNQYINFNTKFLQPPYSRTIKIQVENILPLPFKGGASEDFFGVWFGTYFESVVTCFESKTRYNARLAKKKGLQIFWDKSDETFEEFWSIMEKTSDRQEFVPYTRSYYKNVLKNDWADLVLVKTPEGQTTNAWMGSFISGMGMYLYGGSDLSFSSLKGAEYIHTAAIIRTLQKCGKTVETDIGGQFELVYDMGGSSLLDGALPAWDGYSKFKKGFGGKIVEYLPHTYDVIYKPFKYNLLKFSIDFLKPFLKKMKRIGHRDGKKG